MTLKEKVLENDYVMYKLSQILLYNHTQHALTNNINTGECQILLCTFIIPCEKREREKKKKFKRTKSQSTYLKTGRVKILNKFLKTTWHQHNHNIVIYLSHLLKSNIHVTLVILIWIFCMGKNIIIIIIIIINTRDKISKFFFSFFFFFFSFPRTIPCMTIFAQPSLCLGGGGSFS